MSVCAAVSLSGCMSTVSSLPPVSPNSILDVSPFGEILSAEREANSLNPLQPNEKLTKAAQGHADDMSINGYFNHNSQDGTTFGERIRAEGYMYCWAAENIAKGYTSPESVFDGWMGSADHRVNMLAPEAMEFGLGYAPSGHYWVLNLGSTNC